MIRSAVIDSTGVYRYSLTRIWEPCLSRVGWIMLNPSTADAEADDATIRRCLQFSRDLGFGSLVVVNLYALRSTDPDELLRSKIDPTGPENAVFVRKELSLCAQQIAAWGAHPAARGQFSNLYGELLCLGRTKSGEPRHPLYVRKDAKLELWP